MTMGSKTQPRLNISSLILLAVAFVVAIAISNQVFRGWRIDLTENNLYTLSAGTKDLLNSLDEPINLYFYFSDDASQSITSLRSYAQRVKEMLEEFEIQSNGNIQLNIIDPLPFSEDEDRATQFGLQGVQSGMSDDPIYMGLAGTNSIDNQEIIAFFQPDKETFLEYDIAKLISALSSPDKTAIGLISGVEMSGSFDPQSQRMSQPWVVYQQAQQLFEIRNLGTTFIEIPEDVGLLWIVQPKNLTNDVLYAIDQFIMAGGNAIIFVDPHAEVDSVAVEGMPQGMPPMGQGSNLPELFKAWGIDFSSQNVVADAQLALQVSGMDRRPVRHYGIIGVTDSLMSPDDIVTAQLNVINLSTAGSFKKLDDSATTFQALLYSSAFSESMPATQFSFLPDPSTLQSNFVPDENKYALAGRISGNLTTAFPDGSPSNGNNSSTALKDEHLNETAESANLIIVADVDMLADHLWVQVQSFFGQQIANPFANNGAFVINALENLSGNTDLIGVRSRASYTRPFIKVEKLRVAAETRFRQTEEQLQRELDETERRLVELQSAREDSGNILMTPEQQDEIDRFINQRADIRKDLRAVQRGLDEDIERLGVILKVINIALVPFLLTTFLLIGAWRKKRYASL